MQVPTVLSVKDVDEQSSAPLVLDRILVPFHDASCAEIRRRPPRTTPLSRPAGTDGPNAVLFAIGGVALAVLMIAMFHIIAFALDLSDVRDFVAPTAAEARAHGWQALSERAAP